MTVKKAREHIQKAVENLEETDADEDATKILDRLQHQLSGECRLASPERIDTSGHKYLGIRKCAYREK